MKVLDILLIIICIAFIVAMYYANSTGLRVAFNLGAVMCGVAFGVRLGSRLRKNSEDK